MSEGENNAASSGLFAVFLLSIYSLILIPYTIHYFCSAEDNATTQPVAKGKKKTGFSDRLRGLCSKGNLVLLAMWVAWVAMIYYSQSTMADMKPFDPFEILGVTPDASERDIKKAYRKLSLVYHPDKNPDPKAAQYFASYISKAYAALTDEVSRQNYEKYGHPDGPQGMNLGVALPEWMFAKDKKVAPLMLLGLVCGCILLPLAVMSWYMLTSAKFTGPNQIINETLQIFAFHGKYGIKESQSLVRIPETLLCAMEFITLYTPSEHNAALEELRKLVGPAYPDLMSRSNKTFWNRKASLIKVHMLLLAHLERLGDSVPPILAADLKYIRSKSPLLLEEMLKIAASPRYINNPVGWMTPAFACVEMMQCLAQGLPISVRKGSGKAADALPGLMQLPGFDNEVVKKLRKRKINSLADLQALPPILRVSELRSAGVDEPSISSVADFMSALPRLSLAVKVEVDEPDNEIQQGDEVHCKVRVLLSRPSHREDGFALRGSAVRAFTPYNPVPRDESWYFFLVEPTNNAIWTWRKINLMEAERQGLAHPEVFGDTTSSTSTTANGSTLAITANGSSSTAAAATQQLAADTAASSGKGSNGSSSKAGGSGSDEPPGQEVDLAFMAWQKAGSYNLQLVVMSDCWVGADETMPVKVRIAPQSAARAAASQEAAMAKSAGKKAAGWSSDEEDSGAEGGSGSGSDSDSDSDEDDYDSEETGEEESEDGSSSN